MLNHNIYLENNSDEIDYTTRCIRQEYIERINEQYLFHLFARHVRCEIERLDREYRQDIKTDLVRYLAESSYYDISPSICMYDLCYILNNYGIDAADADYMRDDQYFLELSDGEEIPF